MFDLDRLPWFGAISLVLGLLPGTVLLSSGDEMGTAPSTAFGVNQTAPSVSISFPLGVGGCSLSLDEIKNQLSFSQNSPRPSAEIPALSLSIRLNQSRQSRRIAPPGRIDLRFSEKGELEFSDNPSPFWLELEGEKASLSYRDPQHQEIISSSWEVLPQETPIQYAEEFPAGSPFRLLGESKWWGRDHLVEKYGDHSSVERLEMGPFSQREMVDLREGEWIAFIGGRWVKQSDIKSLESEPVARIKKVGSKGLELEGWDGITYVRLALSAPPLPPLKIKPEDLFSQIRVRSEKQISCTIDKQCFVLRPGDWVAKVENRWRILRKNEEKNAFLDGSMAGDLFILDRIDVKSPQKSISGNYFAAGKAQSVSIDYVVPNSKGRGKIGPSKSKGAAR